MEDFSKYYFNEIKFVTKSQAKYYIFTTVLDSLLVSQSCGLEAVPISIVKKMLYKNGTMGYLWGVSAFQTDLWINELVWLKMISFDKENQELSLTEKGCEACQDQRFHIIYASLLEAKHSRQIAKLAFIVAFITAIITIVGLFK